MVRANLTKVLCVDDDQDTRFTFSWIFRNAGFEVLEAGTGADALRMADQHPDLIVLDVNLPDMTGFEVCRRIKLHPATSSIPILHLSACYLTTSDKVQGLESGADGYMTKPIEPKELVAQARALLRVHRAEEQARQSADDWQVTFDAIQDAVALLDRDGRIRRGNAVLGKFLQIEPEGFIGRRLADLLPPLVGGPADPPHVRVFQTHQRETAELRRGADWLMVTADPIRNENGQWIGAVCLFRDVTLRKNLQEQLRQTQKLDAIGRLAGGIAHDFNNLLTAITGSSSLMLARTPADHPEHELLEMIDKAAWRAAELTRQLLGFSRRAKLWLETVDLNKAVAEVARMLQRTLDPHIKIEVKPGKDLWPIQADPSHIDQVLLNLCLNARDAMQGGGSLTLETENVRVDPDYAHHPLRARAGEFVRLRVCDTGHGIPSEIQAFIFDPFFTTKRPGQGTGLGLALVQGIIEQHRGWIEMTSAVDCGTRFDIYLPRATAAAAPSVPAEARLPRGSGTILLAEDDRTIRDLGRAMLQEHGYRVLLAADGQEAVEMYRREMDRIDLVILDLSMPRVGGKEAFYQMVEINPKVRVAFNSGFAPERAAEFRHECVVGFIPKPYREQDLVRAVRVMLEQGALPH